jgi:ligand-binding sensor domain-containing protein
VGVVENPAYTVVTDAAPDWNGGFWAANRLAANGQGLVYFGAGGSPQVVYDQSDGLPGNDISKLLLSGDRLWIAYNGAGLGVLEHGNTPESKSDDVYTHYSIANSTLPTDVINTLCEGYDHRIWAGTPAGLVRIDQEYFPFLTMEPASVAPADGNVLALAQDASGAVWAGTSRGLARLPNGSLTADSAWFAGSSPLPDNRVNCLRLDDWSPRLWIGTENGLAVRPVLTTSVSEAPNVFPNPFEIRYSGDRATFEVPAGSVVDIFNLVGDRVKTLDADCRWDGNNEAGKPVAAGLYLFRVKYADGTTGTGRLGVVR